ncbi:recombinase family protein [Latilactobacillus sakei]
MSQLVTAGVDQENLYSEKFTSAITYRPVFDQLLNTKYNSPGNTLIIIKLDRFARNT